MVQNYVRFMIGQLAAALLMFVAMIGRPPLLLAEDRVLGTVADFAKVDIGPYQRGYLDFWRWSPEFRKQAESASRVEIVADAPLNKHLLRVEVSDAAIFAQGAVPWLRLAPFYPPEADTLRLRVKVVRGELRAFVGGPTAYYANSDVYTRTERLAAEEQPVWSVLDFDLHHPLRRNYRRAGFSTDAERVMYNRWAQEPLGVFLDAGTNGEFLVESIELIARGMGRPFPAFNAADVKTVKPIANFDAGRLANTFTLYMADGEAEWYDESWKRTRPLRFTPAELSFEHNRERNSDVLVARGPSAEEVHCAGVHTRGTAEANAIQVAVHHDAPEYQNTVVGIGRAEAIDFLVFVAPAKQPDALDRFKASAELRQHAGPGFDYQLSYRLIRNQHDADFAIYQTRRYVTPRTWTTLTLPAADFVCVYGSGSYRERLTKNQPLTCDDVMAIAWLNPWCRAGRGQSAVTLRLDDLAFVHVPGTTDSHRSFWQPAPSINIRWIEGAGRHGRERTMLLPGDE